MSTLSASSTHGGLREKDNCLFHIYKKEGDDFYIRRKYKKALDSYSLALTHKKHDMASLVARSRCYFNMGLTQHALEDAEAILQMDTTYTPAIYQKAQILYRLGHYEMALLFFNRGKKLNPNAPGFVEGVEKAQKAINAVTPGRRMKTRECGDLSMYIPRRPKRVGLPPGLKAVLFKEPEQEPLSAGFRKRNVSKLVTMELQKKPPVTLDHFPQGSGRDSHGRFRPPDPSVMRDVLDQLYTDKAYFEKILRDMHASERFHDEVFTIAGDGLAFIAERMLFWAQFGSLPPPPPQKKRRQPLNRKGLYPYPTPRQEVDPALIPEKIGPSPFKARSISHQGRAKSIKDEEGTKTWKFLTEMSKVNDQEQEQPPEPEVNAEAEPETKRRRRRRKIGAPYEEKQIRGPSQASVATTVFSKKKGRKSRKRVNKATEAAEEDEKLTDISPQSASKLSFRFQTYRQDTMIKEKEAAQHPTAGEDDIFDDEGDSESEDEDDVEDTPREGGDLETDRTEGPGEHTDGEGWVYEEGAMELETPRTDDDPVKAYLVKVTRETAKAFENKEYLFVREKAHSVINDLKKYGSEFMADKQGLVAVLHSYLGNACVELQDYDNALKHHKEDLRIGEQMNYPNIRSRALGNIGRTCVFRKEYTKALEFFARKASHVSRPLETAWLYHEIANCFLQLRHYEFARDAAAKAIDAATDANSTLYQLQASVLLAVTEVKLKKFDQAYGNFERALDHAQIRQDVKAETAIRDALKQVNQQLASDVRDTWKAKVKNRQESEGTGSVGARESLTDGDEPELENLRADDTDDESIRGEEQRILNLAATLALGSPHRIQQPIPPSAAKQEPETAEPGGSRNNLEYLRLKKKIVDLGDSPYNQKFTPRRVSIKDIQKRGYHVPGIMVPPPKRRPTKGKEGADSPRTDGTDALDSSRTEATDALDSSRTDASDTVDTARTTIDVVLPSAGEQPDQEDDHPDEEDDRKDDKEGENTHAFTQHSSEKESEEKTETSPTQNLKENGATVEKGNTDGNANEDASVDANEDASVDKEEEGERSESSPRRHPEHVRFRRRLSEISPVREVTEYDEPEAAQASTDASQEDSGATQPAVQAPKSDTVTEDSDPDTKHSIVDDTHTNAASAVTASPPTPEDTENTKSDKTLNERESEAGNVEETQETQPQETSPTAEKVKPAVHNETSSDENSTAAATAIWDTEGVDAAPEKENDVLGADDAPETENAVLGADDAPEPENAVIGADDAPEPENAVLAAGAAPETENGEAESSHDQVVQSAEHVTEQTGGGMKESTETAKESRETNVEEPQDEDTNQPADKNEDVNEPGKEDEEDKEKDDDSNEVTEKDPEDKENAEDTEEKPTPRKKPKAEWLNPEPAPEISSVLIPQTPREHSILVPKPPPPEPAKKKRQRVRRRFSTQNVAGGAKKGVPEKKTPRTAQKEENKKKESEEAKADDEEGAVTGGEEDKEIADEERNAEISPETDETEQKSEPNTAGDKEDRSAEHGAAVTSPDIAEASAPEDLHKDDKADSKQDEESQGTQKEDPGHVPVESGPAGESEPTGVAEGNKTTEVSESPAADKKIAAETADKQMKHTPSPTTADATPPEEADKEDKPTEEEEEKPEAPKVDPVVYHLAVELKGIEEAFKLDDPEGVVAKAEAALSSYTDEELKAEDKQPLVAKLHSFLGSASMKLEDYSKARKHHIYDLAIGERTGDNEIKSRALENLGRVEVTEKNYEKALELYARRAHLERTDDDSARIFHEIANCFFHVNHFGHAGDAAKVALQSAAKSGNTLIQLQSTVLLAVCQAKAQDNETAYGSFETALGFANARDDEEAAEAIRDAMNSLRQQVARKAADRFKQALNKDGEDGDDGQGQKDGEGEEDPNKAGDDTDGQNAEGDQQAGDGTGETSGDGDNENNENAEDLLAILRRRRRPQAFIFLINDPMGSDGQKILEEPIKKKGESTENKEPLMGKVTVLKETTIKKEPAATGPPLSLAKKASQQQAKKRQKATSA